MFEANKRNVQELGEDFLKHAARLQPAGEVLSLPRIGDSLGLDRAEIESLLSVLESEGQVCKEGPDWCLSESGLARGRQLLRAHRIYESYLAESTGMAPSQWHSEAELKEHVLDEAEVESMSEALNRPRYDPHGDAIPTRDLELRELGGCLLSQLSEEGYYRILHVEDEPSAPFEAIIAEGIGPDLVVRVEFLGGGRFRLYWAGHSALFDSAQAAACLVRPEEDVDLSSLPDGNLALLGSGESALVHSIAPVVRGLQRRRLLDLGFVPGSEVMKEGRGAFGGPIRFRVRGTTQALRTDIAAKIYTRAIKSAEEGKLCQNP